MGRKESNQTNQLIQIQVFRTFAHLRFIDGFPYDVTHLSFMRNLQKDVWKIYFWSKCGLSALQNDKFPVLIRFLNNDYCPFFSGWR